MKLLDELLEDAGVETGPRTYKGEQPRRNGEKHNDNLPDLVYPLRRDEIPNVERELQSPGNGTYTAMLDATHQTDKTNIEEIAHSPTGVEHVEIRERRGEHLDTPTIFELERKGNLYHATIFQDGGALDGLNGKFLLQHEACDVIANYLSGKPADLHETATGRTFNNN